MITTPFTLWQLELIAQIRREFAELNAPAGLALRAFFVADAFWRLFIASRVTGIESVLPSRKIPSVILSSGRSELMLACNWLCIFHGFVIDLGDHIAHFSPALDPGESG